MFWYKVRQEHFFYASTTLQDLHLPINHRNLGSYYFFQAISVAAATVLHDSTAAALVVLGLK